MTDWDQRHRAAVPTESQPPSSFLLRHLERLPRGRALDVAMGLGRHALLLAENGFEVDAVDRSVVAVDHVRAVADSRGLSVHAWQSDLEVESLPAGPYQVVVVTNYLQRSLFPDLERVLAPGGMLLYQTSTTETPHAINPAFLLQPGELATAFPRLRVLESVEQDGRASILATKL